MDSATEIPARWSGHDIGKHIAYIKAGGNVVNPIVTAKILEPEIDTVSKLRATNVVRVSDYQRWYAGGSSGHDYTVHLFRNWEKSGREDLEKPGDWCFL